MSEAPGQPWIQFFRERASASVLNLAAATFRRNRLGIEVRDPKDLDTVIRSVEGMIEGVNFDVEFRSLDLDVDRMAVAEYVRLYAPRTS